MPVVIFVPGSKLVGLWYSILWAFGGSTSEKGTHCRLVGICPIIDQRWGELVDATNHNMFVFYGTPGTSPTRGFITKGEVSGTIYDFSQDTSYPICIQGVGAATKNPAILSAYEAARSARFEHGQSGAGA